MKIAFLLDNAYGIGGTIRSTVNLSRALAERHTVEVASLRQNRDKPSLPFDPRVTLTSLIDLRHDSSGYDGGDPLIRQRSERFTEGPDHFERKIATRLGDARVGAYLHRTDADVVIATRPKLNDYLAAYGESRYVRIGQEHLTHAMHGDHVRGHQDAAIPLLDAFVTVSYADAERYRAALPQADGHRGGAGAEITCVPNAVPAPDVEPSDGESKLIVAAGRLIKVKRYDRLLRAFALVLDKHPDWRLRLYGRGKQQQELRALVDKLGLADHAFLMGAHSPIETEWAKGAVAAVSSDAESFGMTVVEAMHCGVPVVSTDCPYGPGEIITNGRDGLLSPLGEESFSTRAYADALLQLIENPGLRRSMGQAALEKAARYAPERIAGEYEQLIERLQARKPRPTDGSGTAGTASPPGTTGTGGADGTKEAGEAGGTHAGTAPAAVTVPGAGAGSRPGRRPLKPLLRRLAAPLFRPLLRPFWRRLRGEQKGRGHARALSRPYARVRVTADGSLTVRLLAARLPKGQAALVLRARNAPGVAPVRLPLPLRAEAVDGWVERRLERSEHRLAEGRWDASVERASDGKRKRVQAQLVETARLLSLPAPLDEEGALVPWVPYATSDGYLAVRAWHRAGHAEVTSFTLEPHGFRLRLDLYGQAGQAAEQEGAALVAVPRKDGGQGFEVPLHPVEGGVRRSAVAELPYDLPAAMGPGGGTADEAGGGSAGGVRSVGRAVWDLWLRPGAGDAEPAARVGRLLDDLADRKRVHVTPCARLGDTGLGLRLYFTVNNDLALMLEPLPQEERPARPAPAAQVSPKPRPGKRAEPEKQG